MAAEEGIPEQGLPEQRLSEKASPEKRSTARMTPERWHQIRGVFDHATSLEVAERTAYLDKRCANDPDLRPEVESLLASHQEAGTRFLNTPAIDLTAQRSKVPNRVGRRVGAYNILEEIGRGGMGEVYRAGRADGQYEKEVAIKFVRGGYDTASVLERFRHERQILASLDHPNIAACSTVAPPTKAFRTWSWSSSEARPSINIAMRTN
jgi:hypothetical protein